MVRPCRTRSRMGHELARIGPNQPTPAYPMTYARKHPELARIGLSWPTPAYSMTYARKHPDEPRIGPRDRRISDTRSVHTLRPAPPSSSPLADGTGEFKGSQGLQVLPHLARGSAVHQPGQDVPQRDPLRRLAENRQDGALALGQVEPDPLRRYVSAGTEAHGHGATGVLDFRAGKSGPLGQFRHPERTPAPVLDNAAPIEDTGDQRVPRTRLVRVKEHLRRQAKAQRTR